MKFSAKLDPDDLVTFNLRYEELLERSNGKYRYEINIQPKNAPITSAGIDVKVMINETLPLKGLSINRLIQKTPESKPEEISENRGSLRANLKTFPNDAHFNYTYSPALDHDGNISKIVINYDVKRPDDGNDIQIGAGRFVHYFVPDPNNVNKQPKHVIFVIDKSGSMNGTKMDQTKDAIMEWLETMNPERNDTFQENYIKSFNFIMFDYSVNYWRGK